MTATSNRLAVAKCRRPAGSESRRTRCHLTRSSKRKTQNCGAFTLAEVLAALLFLAIVIPTAIAALHVASLAGEVAARKGEAARVADRILNECLVTSNWNNGTQSGTAEEGSDEFRWTLGSKSWPGGAMKLVTADVTFSAQGRDYSVDLNTLAGSQTQGQRTGTTQ